MSTAMLPSNKNKTDAGSVILSLVGPVMPDCDSYDRYNHTHTHTTNS